MEKLNFRVPTNIDRIKGFLRRAEEGNLLTIGFLGGSITQGSLATNEKDNYAARVFKWLEDKFPKSVFSFFNAGVGGTSSYFGVARAKSDLLNFLPDLVILDFSVNDETTELFKETYEGLIRKILLSDSAPAIISLGNARYDDAKSAEEIHRPIAEHYFVPYVSVKERILPRIASHEFKWQELSIDGLHPNDLGHALLAEEICKTLTGFLDGKDNKNTLGDKVKNENKAKEPWNRKALACEAGIDASNGKLNVKSDAKAEKKITSNYVDIMEFHDRIKLNLPEPITKNSYENAKIIRADNLLALGVKAVCEGFMEDTAKKGNFREFFRNGWESYKVYDKIHFTLPKCRKIAIQYRKTVKRPSPDAISFVDGVRLDGIILKSDFDEDWGDCLYLQEIFDGIEEKVHTLDIEIIRADKEDKAGFYLLGIIVS